MWFRRRNNTGKKEAAKALSEAENSLRRIEKRGAEVSEVAAALREIKERNHFAETLEAIIAHHGGPLQ